MDVPLDSVSVQRARHDYQSEVLPCSDADADAWLSTGFSEDLHRDERSRIIVKCKSEIMCFCAGGHEECVNFTRPVEHEWQVGGRKALAEGRRRDII